MKEVLLRQKKDDSLVILMESRAFKASIRHGNAIDVGAFDNNADLRRVMGEGRSTNPEDYRLKLLNTLPLFNVGTLE